MRFVIVTQVLLFVALGFLYQTNQELQGSLEEATVMYQVCRSK